MANGVISYTSVLPDPTPIGLYEDVDLLLVYRNASMVGRLYVERRDTVILVKWETYTPAPNTSRQLMHWDNGLLIWVYDDFSSMFIPDNCISSITAYPDTDPTPYQQCFTVVVPAIAGTTVDCEYLYVNGPYASNTITHKTNINNYTSEQIGTFCETTGEIANVYGDNYTPSTDKACDAIVKVKQTNILSGKVLGIIVDADKFATHGDVVCRVDEDEYELGDILTPSSTGLTRKATQEERLLMLICGVPMVKITAKISDNSEVVCCFIQ
jgi:hypothetical protein